MSAAWIAIRIAGLKRPCWVFGLREMARIRLCLGAMSASTGRAWPYRITVIGSATYPSLPITAARSGGAQGEAASERLSRITILRLGRFSARTQMNGRVRFCVLSTTSNGIDE